jgi:AcrR family transcriptional regulator
MARVAGLKKAQPSAEVSQQGRDELVEVAIDLFAKNGYAGTSIRDIAFLCNRSVSNVYHYFENKEALWLAILEQSVKALPGKLRAAMAERSDAMERFEALVRRESRIFFIDQERLSPQGNKANRRIQREILDIYLSALEDLRKAGRLGSTDTRTTALNVLGVINWYLRWSKPGASAAQRGKLIDEVWRFVRCAVDGG